MDLQLILLDQARFRQKLANVLTLIALQLKHLTILRMFDHGSVTSEFLKIKRQTTTTLSVTFKFLSLWANQSHLLACSDNLLQVVVRGQTLDSCECFATIPLLNSDVN